MDEIVKAYAIELAKEQVKLIVEKEMEKMMIASKSQPGHIRSELQAKEFG